MKPGPAFALAASQPIVSGVRGFDIRHRIRRRSARSSGISQNQGATISLAP
jgi:hypothetical protein